MKTRSGFVSNSSSSSFVIMERDTIPFWMVESAVENGWEVSGYKDYQHGTPRYVCISKEMELPEPLPEPEDFTE